MLADQIPTWQALSLVARERHVAKDRVGDLLVAGERERVPASAFGSVVVRDR